eukprot:scaffold21672_cov47-Phaeocystis_antarctica.AAC.2
MVRSSPSPPPPSAPLPAHIPRSFAHTATGETPHSVGAPHDWFRQPRAQLGDLKEAAALLCIK